MIKRFSREKSIHEMMPVCVSTITVCEVTNRKLFHKTLLGYTDDEYIVSTLVDNGVL
jgi:hypothetical protein